MSSDVELPEGGVELSDPPWDPWLPTDVAALLGGVDVTWYIAAAGWALDLYRGFESRQHEDLEIAVPASGFATIRAALGDYEFQVVGAGRGWPVDSPAFDLMHQTWVRDPSTGAYRLDVFREMQDGDVWICRRDESIRLPYSEIIRHSAGGLPYLRPEIVLLFKARLGRPKDDADLEGILPLLDARERSWLRSLVGQVHPGHRWLGVI